MPYTASAFQRIMCLVKHWWLQGFEDMRVDGQLALAYDDARQTMVEYVHGQTMLEYVYGYVVLRRPADMDYMVSHLRAANAQESQARGAPHFHSSPWIRFPQSRGAVHRHIWLSQQPPYVNVS